MTYQLQCFGSIGLSYARYVGKVSINGYLSCGFDAHSNKKSLKIGIPQKLLNKIRLSLIKVALENSQSIQYLESNDL